MRTTILLSITATLFACQEQTTENTNESNEGLVAFSDYTEALEASPSTCVFGGEINAEFDETTLEVVDVELGWTEADFRNPSIPTHGGWERENQDIWVDLSAVEQRYKSTAEIEGSELIIVQTETFDIEIEINSSARDSVTGDWYYCPKSTDLPTPQRDQGGISEDRLEELNEKVATIRESQP